MAKENPRKQIILNEILFWKRNKLLPEQYCDFLTALYSEGNEVSFDKEISDKKSVKAKEKRNYQIAVLLVIVMVIASLVSLFSFVHFAWMISVIVGVISLLFMFSAFFYVKNKSILFSVLLIGAALLIFGLSVKVSTTFFPDYSFVLHALLVGNCIMWIVSGIKLKLIYFTLSGSLGLFVLIFYKLLFT